MTKHVTRIYLDAGKVCLNGFVIKIHGFVWSLKLFNGQ